MQRFVYHSAWKGAKMSICEVVEMRNSADVVGYLCSRTASKECSDCGIALCEDHAEPCGTRMKQF